jgi:hypothetical protein
MAILAWPCLLALPWPFSPLGGFCRHEINDDVPVLRDISENIVSFLRIKKNL